MPINTVIREKRKESGLTQEQIAEYLGVTAPAVNKWEKGTNYPDITLLPPLARLLKVDLNTLLCFNEEITEQEISAFMKEMSETAQKEGFRSAFDRGICKVQEYPNCGKLLHWTAMFLDGALIMSGLSEEEKKEYENQIMQLYERGAKCGDTKIETGSAYMLASKYMACGEYEKAQEMIDRLPERNYADKRQLQANLFIKQGKLDEAAKLLERKLMMMETYEVQIILFSLAEIAFKKGDIDKASKLGDISGKAAGLFGLWDYYAYVGPLLVALDKKNVEESVSLLKAMFETLLVPWNLEGSPLYENIAATSGKENLGVMILPALLAELENGSKYEFLRPNEDFQRMIQQYRAVIENEKAQKQRKRI